MEFIFKSFWTFAGTVLILGMISKTIIITASILMRVGRFSKDYKEPKKED